MAKLQDLFHRNLRLRDRSADRKPQRPSPASRPAPLTTSPPGSAVAKASPGNSALQLAIQRHLDKIPDDEKEAFRKASAEITQHGLISRVKAYDEAHKQASSFRSQAERLSKFLDVLDRFMGGIAIGIQAYPEISSLVVGAVRIVLDLAIHFVAFFGKLTDMICQLEEYLWPLSDYDAASRDLDHIQEAVANIYGDLLDFCRRARDVFADRNGKPRKLTSLRLFLRVQWEPFEVGFAPIQSDMAHHLDVLSHASQAHQLKESRKAEQERNRVALHENSKFA